MSANDTAIGRGGDSGAASKELRGRARYSIRRRPLDSACPRAGRAAASVRPGKSVRPLFVGAVHSCGSSCAQHRAPSERVGLFLLKGEIMISQMRQQQLIDMIKAGEEGTFYHWSEWESLRAQVLRMDHYECQICKAKGRYKKAAIVHHVKHLRDRPDLALSIWDGEERQLVSVCKKCHEEEHPESLRQYAPRLIPVTDERWD